MDLYAINDWDAWIYAYGANLVNLLYSSVVWKSLVIIFTVFAFLKIVPSLRDSGNVLKDLLMKVGAIVVFSALTLWPVETKIDVYRITKADAYTNVFKWIVPVGRDQELKGELVLSMDAELPVVQAFAGWVLGYMQFWTMWLVDKAGTTLGLDSMSSGSFMNAAKLGTIVEDVKNGIDTVIADLKDKGEWTPEDQIKYADFTQDLQDFLAKNCLSPDAVSELWEKTTDGDPVSVSLLKENVNPNLSPAEQEECRQIAERIESTVSDICQKWSSVNDGAPTGICESMVSVSTWQKIKNFFTNLAHSASNLKETVKGMFSKGVDFVLGLAKEIIIGLGMAVAAFTNIFLLGGIVVVVPIALGILNLFVFFLSPIFFLTQLVQGKFVDSTVRILLEMLWARLLYAVYALAYTLTALLQIPAWKSVLGIVGGVAAKNPELVAEIFAKKVASSVIGVAGFGMLLYVMTHVALTLAVGSMVLFMGAKLLRTLIFDELLFIADVLTGGRHQIVKSIGGLLKK